MKRAMRISDLIVRNFESELEVPIQFKINRKLAWEFKNICKKSGYTMTQALEASVKQFILEEKPKRKDVV